MVSDCEPSVFQPHQCDVVYEWHVARKPTASGNNSWGRNRVQYHANLDPLCLVLKLKDSEYCFIKGTPGLHYVVVDVVRGSVNRDSNREIRMLEAGPAGYDFG